MGASGRPPFRPEALHAARMSGAVAVVALVLTALTMRAPITVMGPLLTDVAAEVGDLSLAALLVSLPLLAFSIAAPVFPVVLRRLGLSRSIQIALGTLAAGLALRQLPDVVWLLTGTVVAGVGIAALNVAMPVVVKARWPTRVGLVTGIHTSVTAMAAAAAAALALPLAELVGWRGSMASVGALVALAAGLAAAVAFSLSAKGRGSARARGSDSGPSPTAASPHATSPAAASPHATAVILHRTTLWLSALMALQAGTYYSLVSWLPAVLVAAGRPEGDVAVLQGLFVALGVITGPLAGMWLQSGRARAALALACTLPLVVALAGLAVAPGAALLWVVLAGLACGGSFTLTLALFAIKSSGPAVTAVVSAAAQSIGYVAAAAVPPVLGALAAREGSWQLALLVLGAVALVQAVVAVGAVGSSEVGGPRAP